MTNKDQAAAVGFGAFIGTALANSLEQPSTITGGGGTVNVDLSPVVGELQLIETTLSQLLTAINNLASSLGTGTGDLSTLQAIQADLDLMIKPGAVQGTIDVISLTSGAAVQQLYVNPTKVRKALIQNISTDAVTLFTSTGTSNGIHGTAGSGTVLNPASVSGQGGGSLPVTNEDLSNYFFVGATTADKVSVWREF